MGRQGWRGGGQKDRRTEKLPRMRERLDAFPWGAPASLPVSSWTPYRLLSVGYSPVEGATVSYRAVQDVIGPYSFLSWRTGRYRAVRFLIRPYRILAPRTGSYCFVQTLIGPLRSCSEPYGLFIVLYSFLSVRTEPCRRPQILIGALQSLIRPLRFLILAYRMLSQRTDSYWPATVLYRAAKIPFSRRTGSYWRATVPYRLPQLVGKVRGTVQRFRDP